MSNFYTFNLAPLVWEGPVRAITQELLCSFFFVFFFQISTDDKLLFSNEKAINCFIIASSYVGSRAVFAGNTVNSTQYYGAVMNPAIALGITLSSIFDDGFTSFKSVWLYPTVPFGGAFLSVLFYELIYKKAQRILAHDVDDAISDDLNNSRSNSVGEHD